MKRGQVPEPAWFTMHPTELVVVLIIVALIIMYLLFVNLGVWK